jgi:putative phosphoribosyl transferase
MRNQFQDRREAGRLLAAELAQHANRDDVIVLGLPRGGVPVAFEVALRLDAPLDVFVVRKLGVPGYRELAMGAIATGDVRVLNREVIDGLGISRFTVDAVAAEELRELARREEAYRGHDRAPLLRDKTVILVDDGIATGSTMRAAIEAIRKQKPGRLVVAVPTAAPGTCLDLKPQVDDMVTLMMPENFQAVGEWYEDFSQTTDSEVTRLLQAARVARSVSRAEAV